MTDVSSSDTAAAAEQETAYGPLSPEVVVWGPVPLLHALAVAWAARDPFSAQTMFGLQDGLYALELGRAGIVTGKSPTRPDMRVPSDITPTAYTGADAAELRKRTGTGRHAR